MNPKIEEIIEALRCRAHGDDCTEECVCYRNRDFDCVSNFTVLTAAADRLEVLEARQRWIPVTEKLPEDRFEVLVYTDRYGGRHEFAYYIHRLGAWYQNCALLIPNVTHWMPLPEPPKEDK